jgi:hypothetical protein
MNAIIQSVSPTLRTTRTNVLKIKEGGDGPWTLDPRHAISDKRQEPRLGQGSCGRGPAVGAGISGPRIFCDESGR